MLKVPHKLGPKACGLFPAPMVLRCNQSEAQMPRELASLLLLWPQISKRRRRQSSDQGACTHMSGPQGPRDVKKGHGGRVKNNCVFPGYKAGLRRCPARPAAQQTSRASSSLASSAGEQGDRGLLQTSRASSTGCEPGALLAMGARGAGSGAALGSRGGSSGAWLSS